MRSVFEYRVGSENRPGALRSSQAEGSRQGAGNRLEENFEIEGNDDALTSWREDSV